MNGGTLKALASTSVAALSSNVQSKAKELYSTGNFEAAIDLLTRAIKIDSGCIQLYFNRSLCFSAVAAYENAFDDAKMAFDLAFAFANHETKIKLKYFLRLAKSEIDMKFLEGAIDTLKRAERINNAQMIIHSSMTDVANTKVKINLLWNELVMAKEFEKNPSLHTTKRTNESHHNLIRSAIGNSETGSDMLRYQLLRRFGSSPQRSLTSSMPMRILSDDDDDSLFSISRELTRQATQKSLPSLHHPKSAQSRNQSRSTTPMKTSFRESSSLTVSFPAYSQKLRLSPQEKRKLEAIRPPQNAEHEVGGENIANFVAMLGQDFMQVARPNTR